MGGRIHGATSASGASNSTRVLNSQPVPRFCSSAATGSNPSGNWNSYAVCRTARTRSTRYVRIASARCEWHSRYQRPYRTTTAHGSTSPSHSLPDSPRYMISTRCRAATAATSALVVVGSGRDG